MPETEKKKLPLYCYQCVAGPDLMKVEVEDGVLAGVGDNRRPLQLAPIPCRTPFEQAFLHLVPSHMAAMAGLCVADLRVRTWRPPELGKDVPGVVDAIDARVASAGHGNGAARRTPR